MQRITEFTLSPVTALYSGYGFLAVGALVCFQVGFFVDNTFFRWGPPVTIIGQEILTEWLFYGLIFFLFVHQLINSWISVVVYPYIINEIQNVNVSEVRYRERGALMIAAFFNVYSMLDALLLVSATYSQVSFFSAIVLAEVVSSTWTNYHHLQKKRARSDLAQDGVMM